MIGTYSMMEMRRRVRVIEWRGNRVLLEELDTPPAQVGRMQVETDLANFTPDLDPPGPRVLRSAVDGNRVVSILADGTTQVLNAEPQALTGKEEV